MLVVIMVLILYLYVAAAKKYLLNNTTHPYITEIEIGQAGQSSMVPSGLLVAGKKFCNDHNKNFPQQQWNCDSLKLPKGIKIVSFPEFYWFNELKPKGCVGCPHSLENNPYELDATNVTDITTNNICNSTKCTKIKKDLIHYTPTNMIMSNKCKYDSAAKHDICTASDVKCDTDKDCGVFTLYDKCITQGCDEMCCKSLGCLPCKYNSKNTTPNNAIIYQKNRNNPGAMLSDLNNYNTLNTYTKKYYYK